MTTKEAIHSRVDELDEDSVELVFVYVDLLARVTGAGIGHDRSGIEAARTRAKHDKESAGSLRSLIGILGDGEPTDIENHKDEYIADAIESHVP